MARRSDGATIASGRLGWGAGVGAARHAHNKDVVVEMVIVGADPLKVGQRLDHVEALRVQRVEHLVQHAHVVLARDSDLEVLPGRLHPANIRAAKAARTHGRGHAAAEQRRRPSTERGCVALHWDGGHGVGGSVSDERSTGEAFW